MGLATIKLTLTLQVIRFFLIKIKKCRMPKSKPAEGTYLYILNISIYDQVPAVLPLVTGLHGL